MAGARRLLVVTTGGTIAGRVARRDDGSDSDKPSQVAKNLAAILEDTIDHIRELWGVDVSLHVDPIADVNSSDIVPKHWVAIVNTIAKGYDDYDGFIVTHGTNTMGYTSAALTFALGNLGKPVVVTGSQVPFGWPGSDALMNLENALRVAAWPYSGGIRGVVVVFGSHIITGARAKKNTEFDYDAFQSFSTASLGRIGRIIDFKQANLQRHHYYLSKERPEALRARNLDVRNTFDSRLLSFTEFPGMDPKTFERVLASLIDGPNGELLKGVVFRAFGAGDVSNHLHSALKLLKKKRIPIVVTTQAPNGNSNFRVNEPGQRLAKGELAIPAFDMSIESITTKLMWLIGQGVTYGEIHGRMLQDLHGEIAVEAETV